MPNFTDAQITTINKEKKDSADLPKYYFAKTKTEVPISRDFESYLILESQEHKQKTLSWIKDVQNIQKDSVDRDAILNKFLSLRLSDADSTIKELDGKLNNFDDFKAGLFAVGDPNGFAEVLELSLLVQSLQSPLDEMKFLRDRAFHEKVMCNITMNRLKASGSSEETQKELASWQTVVSTYKGQSGSTVSDQQNMGSEQSRGEDQSILNANGVLG